MTPPTQGGASRLSDVARHLILPKGIVSTGFPAVAAQLSRAEIPLDRWQQGLAVAITAKRESGQYACGIGGAVISIPRQTGKTYTIGAIVFALCMSQPGLLVLWTAHRTRTHNETFRAMDGMAQRAGVKPFIANVRKANGEQEIEFTNGSRILFGARESGFGRGFAQVDIIVLDEAQILTEKAMEDMVPAANAAPNGLVIMMGTPPRPTDPGEVFTARRDAALSGDDPDVLYVEMSADEGANPNDREQWAKANPSYPVRTSESSILRMRKLLGSVASFMREGLGIWDRKVQGRRAFKAETWDARMGDPPSSGLKVFGVKFAADGSHVALAGAMKPEDGPIHVEGIKQAPLSDGTQWLIDFLVERKDEAAQIVIDGKSGVGYLVNALKAERVGGKVILVPTLDQVVTAHSTMERAVVEGGMTHSGQAELDGQAKSAIRRKIGANGGFGWDASLEGESVTLLDASTLALYGAKTTKRNPKRRQAFL